MVVINSILLRFTIFVLFLFNVFLFNGCNHNTFDEYPDISNSILFTAYKPHKSWTTPKYYREIYLIKVDERGELFQLTRDRSEEQNPIWLSDGETIAFLRFRGRIEEPFIDIFIKNLSNGKEKRIIKCDQEDENIGFGCLNFFDNLSAGKNNNLFFEEGKTSFYSFNWSGSEIERLFYYKDLGFSFTPEVSTNPIVEPSVSPDAKKVIFINQNVERIKGVMKKSIPGSITGAKRKEIANGIAWKLKEICVCNIDGSDFTILTEDTFPDFSPKISPDGQFIAYVSERPPYRVIRDTIPTPRWLGGGTQVVSRKEGNFDIFVMDTEGQNLRRLTTDPGRDTEPTWSPDGKQIAFISDRSGRNQIWVMNADGTNQHQLTHGDLICDSPCWSPK
ncbi:PD40 domain-containing protein [candidate division WOR-3 bacterium]|nr:PD40 domain-containing protein [candidate division WOR-3 bacterium]